VFGQAPPPLRFRGDATIMEGLSGWRHRRQSTANVPGIVAEP
jgi:hypothetical protein